MKITTLEKFSIESVKLAEGVSDKLVVQIKAIHVGLTRNLTNYKSDTLKNSLDAWTQPYQKKVLKNHDINSEPLGRVLSATYVYDEVAKRDVVSLVVEITDQDAIQKILDKRYTTVSVGGSSNSVVCSICGTDIAKEGMCEHYKGEMYDGQLAFWNIENFEPDEVSFVNAPADIFAGVEEVCNDPLQRPNMPQMMNQSANNPNLKESSQNLTDESTKGGQSMELTLEQLQAKVSEMTQKVEESNTALVEANTKLEDANTQLQESNAKLEESTAKVTELTEQVATLEGQVETLNTEVATVKAEKEAVEEQVTGVRAESHKLAAEKVAVAKLFLGKITKEQYEAEVEELKARTAESLNDTLADLIKESVSVIAGKILEDPIEDPTKKVPVQTAESTEFDSRQHYANFLDSEISKLFR